MRKKIKANFLLGILIMLWVVLLSCGLVLGNLHYFLVDDSLNYFFPNFVFNFQSLVQEGKFPLINLFQLLGNRYLAQGPTAVLYGPVYFSVWFAKAVFGDPVWSTSVFLGIHMIVAGWGMQLLIGRKGKLIDNLILVCWFLSFPFLFGVIRSWLNVGVLIAYLPIGLFCLRNILGGSARFGSWLGLVGTKLGLIYFGYFPWVIMILFIEILIIGGWMSIRKKLRVGMSMEWYKYAYLFLRYGLSLLVVGLIGAPILMPVWDGVGRSATRGGVLPFHEFINLYVKAVDFFRAQLGWFVDDVISKSGSHIYFIGPGFLILILITLGFKKLSKLGKVLCVMAWMTLSFSTVIGGLLYLIPVLNWFRYPVKFFPFFLVFLVWLVAVWMSSQNKRVQIIIRGVLVVGIILNVWVLMAHAQTDDAFSAYEYETIDELGVNGRVLSVNGTLDHKMPVNKLMTHNFSSLYGLYGVGGYDPVVSKKNYELAEGVTITGSWEGEVGENDVERWGRKGVEWVVTNEEFEYLIDSLSLEEITRKDGVVWYRNTKATPMVYIIGDQEKLADAEMAVGVNEIRVNWNQGQHGILKILFAAIEGWKYDLGSGFMSINTSNEFIEIPIKESDDQVILRFYDNSFEKGKLLMIGGVILIWCWWIVERKIVKGKNLN